MARPNSGRCVHCLRHSEERNWDHVFPKSWYPDTTPANLAKWKVPSCLRCNTELGVIEREFLVRVALCLDPNNPASRSIVQKALRAMKPEYAKNPLEKLKRIALAKRINSELLQGHQIPSEGVYPSLGERWDRGPASGKGMPIPAESFRRITEKIVRGITYLEGDRYIDPPYTVEFFALNDEGARPLQELIEVAGTALEREPGIVVRHTLAPEDGISMQYEIEFWKQFRTHAAVVKDTS